MKIILHQTGPSNLPKVYKDCSKSWDDKLFKYKFYDDKDLEELIKSKLPENYNFYMKLRNIEKIDFARYVMMYHYGGIYADMDTILKDISYIRKIFNLSNKIVIGIEFNKLRFHAAQSILISTSKHNPFWLDLVSYIVRNYDKDKYITYNTGPDMYTSFLKQYGYRYDILYDEKLLKGIRHVKTGNWRISEYKNLNKECLICNNKPFLCFCYNHKWYKSSNFIYFNYKLLIIFGVSILIYLNKNLLFS